MSQDIDLKDQQLTNSTLNARTFRLGISVDIRRNNYTDSCISREKSIFSQVTPIKIRHETQKNRIHRCCKIFGHDFGRICAWDQRK